MATTNKSSFVVVEELGTINEAHLSKRGPVILKMQISEFNGRRSIGIRGFYTKDGELLPSDTGINLTFDEGEILASKLVELYQRPDIEALFVADGKTPEKTATAKVTVKEVAAATEKRMNALEDQNKALAEQNSQMMAMMQQLLGSKTPAESAVESEMDFEGEAQPASA